MLGVHPLVSVLISGGGAVYDVHLLLLGLIGGIWVYGGCWRPPGAVRAGWWQIGMAWHGVWWCLAPTWQGECLLH